VAVKARALPSSQAGQPYVARVADAAIMTAADGTGDVGVVIILVLERPTRFRGHKLAHLIKMRAANWEADLLAAALELSRFGVPPDVSWDQDLPAALRGRWVRFNYAPPTQMDGADERIEVVGSYRRPH